MSETLSLREAADFLGVSYRTVRRYVKKGLPYVEARGDRGIEYRIRREDLESFRLAEGGGEQEPGAAEKGEDHSPSAKGGTATIQETEPAQPRALDAESSRGLMQQLLELYESEISFLREQIRVKDEQLAMKERQFFSFQETFSRLTHQNEVLTMIAQGVEPSKLLRKASEEETPFGKSSTAGPFDRESEEPVVESGEPALNRDEIVAKMKQMHKEGKSQWEIREFVKKHGYSSVGELLAK